MIFAISALIVAGLFIMESYDIMLIGNGLLTIVLSILILLTLIVAIRKFTARKNKLPTEDEYTKKK